MAGSDRASDKGFRFPHRVHVGWLVFAVVVIGVLLLLLWSVMNHQRFRLDTTHRGTLREELDAIAAVTGGSLIRGNAIEVGQNGDYFHRLFEDIEAAEETIHFETYIWWPGEVSRKLARLLAARAADGLEVRVLLDWAGAREISEESLSSMRDAGAEVTFYRPPTFRSIGRLNFRTHRKIAVIDGRIAYLSGHGIADQWTGNAERKDRYRDTFVRIRGPIVRQIQAAFFENWLEETRTLPVGKMYFPELESAGDVTAHIAYYHPIGDVSSVEALFYTVVSAATEEVVIQNPYFVVEETMLQLFERAIDRGVRIRVMIPSVLATDNAIVQHASHHQFERLLSAGVELYVFDKTLLHQKVMVVDGIWSAIGSTNFDDRSFELNDEIQIGMLDREIASDLLRAWDRDVRFARRIDLEEWRERGWLHKIQDELAYLLNEQL
ncbi:MAG: phospholipase D-like domain-containing protein [Thermoanaerobaculia bacterium]|nr:phospholipase D-like domain-containing protein [Thermoanaerobaculia bacterium]